MQVSDVELEYQRRVDSMSPAEKLARAAAMLAWAKSQIAFQIKASNPQISDERLKWCVAKRLYGAEPEVLKLIEQQLENVPD